RVAKTAERLKKDYSRLVMEDKMISLGKMMASITHELNNPMSGILNLAKLVAANFAEGIDTPDQKEENTQYLELIISEIDRCSKIVSNLLYFSRQQPKEERPVKVCEVMDRVLAIADHRMKIQRIYLKLEYDPHLPPIPFQAGQLDQTFMNIVFNAMEAMPDGGVLLVRTRHDVTNNQAVITIKDSG
ncbi:MAG: hypothetical protein HQK60_09535, partial [Deltaproteobacteria bacterium]|nr:hypothetical protein [Deltaproteobacteria bacterium]